jgi:Holliday junction resolvasome RuvABC endonuclease subunit
LNILVLDPAASCGYCLLKVEDKVANIYEYGFIDIGESEFVGDRCIYLMDKIEQMLVSHSITHVAVEDYFFSSRFATGSDVNVAFRTAIYIKCRQHKIDYQILSVSGWKKFIAGRSTPSKAQKLKWGKAPAKKLMIQEALYQKYKIRFPNHSISEKTQKPIKFRTDIVDAVAQAIYYCRLYLDIQEVKSSMSIPEDVDIKTLFNYGDYDAN